MIRVLIADDHPVMRAGLESVLRLEPGFVPVGAVPVRDACAAARRSSPHVLVGTRGPLAIESDVPVVIDDARNLPQLLDLLRLAARRAAA